MVDFKQKLKGKVVGRPTDPLELYETLDRSVDKGPLRPAQEAVLREWYSSRLDDRNILLKLHTGQGKTLVGLLMLQSQLNRNQGPAVYVCPDNFLIDQTCEQAKQFGIKTCRADPELPDAFLNGERILVTSVQKIFNGLTKFGIHRRSMAVGTFLMDDAHACSDTIRDQCRIRIPSDEPAYNALRTIFAEDLEMQGLGTYADLLNGSWDALLPVPYWAWRDRLTDVAKILSGESDKKSIKFSWPLLRDILDSCQCVFSGVALEIEPYVAPLDAFGSYANATQRIFMSATVTDDAFLIKGLKLDPETITTAVTYSKERWSGEKMVLIPSLISDALDHDTVINAFAKPAPSRRCGVVALIPGFRWSRGWEKCGSRIADKDSLSQEIDRIRQGNYSSTLVLVNRYHGVDLPDDTCRILIFDSKPFSENLADRYEEACRPNSASTLMRAVRTVEQGMGRSVRGEKDYSVVVVVGSELTRLLRDRASRAFLSAQMSSQIDIGLEIAAMAQDEIQAGSDPQTALLSLVNQCLERDEGWKSYYVSTMAGMEPKEPNMALLMTYKLELNAEQKYSMGDYGQAAKLIQDLLDSTTPSPEDKGWYLQMMARFNDRSNRIESQRLQLAAHRSNKWVLKPSHGTVVTTLSVISQGRVERIIEWVRKHGSYEQLDLSVSDILSKLHFGVAADKFEYALNELSFALGFVGERPDKEWKEGPDNLWALDDTKYIIWECKSEVEVTRSEINKREAEQMNRSAAWFIKHYPGLNSRKLLVHPANREASAASFLHEVEVVRTKELSTFVRSIRGFFKSFESVNFDDLSPLHVQSLIDSHRLAVSNLMSDYAKKIKPMV